MVGLGPDLDRRGSFTPYLGVATLVWGQHTANGNMKQNLHWNVSGIPPEARDVARAAATKEGLSVGDWLTKRILAEQGSTGAPATPSEHGSAQSDARPDLKPVGPRLVRLESESDSTSRRLEESLRSLTKRIELSERTQIEAQRMLSAVAAEIHTANRDQAEAFALFAERIERAEKNSDNAPLRDAVRGLHQGVAMLTEQIGKTAAESAGQVAILASSVEAMALKIASVRDESVRLERVIEERLNALSERVRQMDEAVQATPRSQQALETRIDEAELRMREALSQHAAAVERDLGTIVARLEDVEQARGQGLVQETIATLNRRFETSERRSKEVLATLQAGLSDATDRISTLEIPGSRVSQPAPRAIQPSEITVTPAAPVDLRTPPPVEAETQAEPARTEATGAHEYLAQARRAAQAAADPASAWPAGAVRRPRERSRIARALTQGFFLLLVMCTGFLLMQYFGPRPDAESIRSVVGASVTPELRDLETKAKQGVAAAELLLGLRYAEGNGVEANETEAAKWFESAAQKGVAIAQYRLGTLYEKGLGVTADPKLAADWYAKAAELGNVRAMHNLAVAFANGNGREANYTEAARWFRAAAERGLADSQFNLAVLHERGLGVETSLSDAYRWYAIAAAQGDGESGTRVEALLSQIPAADRAAADRAVETFKAMPADSASNEAPPLSQVLN